MKQWHLPPSEVTYPKPKRPIPQEQNQTALYKILSQWVSKGQVHTIVAEGCEGAITPQFEDKFNGWGFPELSKVSSRSDYSEIVSHVPLKLKARFKDKIAVICGDNKELINSQNMAFSDARGTIGFLKRLIEHEKSPDRAKPYLDAATQQLGIPATTPLPEVTNQLKKRLEKILGQIKTLGEQRNQILLKSISATKDKDVALVVGGAHATDLKLSLEKQGLGCQVVEPSGYLDGPNALLDFSEL